MLAHNPTLKDYAALAYSLSILRGQLHCVLTDEVDHDRITRIYKGTSAASIAKALMRQEDELAIDWSQHLSPAEMDEIRGHISG